MWCVGTLTISSNIDAANPKQLITSNQLFCFGLEKTHRKYKFLVFTKRRDNSASVRIHTELKRKKHKQDRASVVCKTNGLVLYIYDIYPRPFTRVFKVKAALRSALAG